ncbi:YtxH domain-containing protein [Candidatus Peregrinibacteria bacterium]|nr:YtxH domain-containing protein [Candidatus Peregrinibacteria bacterium]
MGAIIGGAIGSVLGASIAPKKGAETRREIKETAIKAGKKGKTLIQKVITLLGREKSKKIPLEQED